MWDESKHPRDAIGRWTNGKGEADRKKEQEAEKLYNDDWENSEEHLKAMAKNQAKAKNMAKDAHLSGRYQDAYSRFLAEALKIFENYDLDMLRTIESTRSISGDKESPAGALGDRLLINKRTIGNYREFYAESVTNYHNNLAAAIKSAEENLRKAQSRKDSEESGYWEDVIKELEDGINYSRENVLYEQKELECIAAHEMGHIIADQYFGQVRPKLRKKSVMPNVARRKKQMVVDIYNQSLENGEIYMLSRYASTEPAEFFAEAFTMYHMGVEEELPPRIKDMMEEVLRL